MNYQNVYNSLINSALAKKRLKSKEQYFELHHIIPKCLGGNDKKDNLVLLTSREHYMAHKLLVKINPKSKPLIFAWNMMTHTRGHKKRLTLKEYSLLRDMYSKAMSSTISGENNGFYGKTHTKEFRLEHSKRMCGENNPRYGIKLTDEEKEHLRKLNLGKTMSDESRKKISQSKKNRKWITKDTKTKLVKLDDIDNYLSNGWVLGRYNAFGDYNNRVSH